MIKFLDLYAQYQTIKDEVNTAIEMVIKDSAFIGGDYVRVFEESFAHYQQAEYCLGVGNGTDALEIAIAALDFPPGSEIIVPANSFIASAEAVTRCGHRVVFCDVNLDDYTLDVDNVRALCTDKTVAVIAVHLYGHPCDMASLTALAHERGMKIIEDCAQAHGAEYQGRRVGALSDVACFSFYPGKNLGAMGDGGAIVSNDQALIKKCRMLANHGRVKKYQHEFAGRNSRLDGLQAAILNVKLKHLDDWINARNAIAQSYIEQLQDITQLILPIQSDNVRHAYHLFVVRCDKRDELKDYLGAQSIQTSIHYPILLPRQAAYTYAKDSLQFFRCRQIDSELLSLPIGEHLNSDNISVVVQALRSFFQNGVV